MARRIPVVQGRSHDFGPDGKLLVCDANGAYLVDNRCRSHPIIFTSDDVVDYPVDRVLRCMWVH